MNIARTVISMAAVALMQMTSAAHADTWHTSKIKSVYPLGDGSIVLMFTSDAPACTNGNSDKYHYIRAGQFGVTADGLRMLAATALMAHASDKTITILFDESSSSCDINRLMTRD